jgi:hypothetical protein
VIGDINTLTTSNQVPINMFYKNSVTETIYLQGELQMSSGTIQAIVYQNNFTQDLTKPIRIWMKNTTDTDLSAGWPTFTDYTLVFDGTVHFPLGVNAIAIPLTTPFNYTGGNLNVRVYRVWEDAYWNSTNHFYYTASTVYPNRVRSAYADGTAAFDPTNPASVSLNYILNNVPNTALIVNPAVPIVDIPAPVLTATLSGTDIVLNWDLIPEANSYQIYETDDPYNWPTTPLASVHTNTYTVASGAMKFYKVVANSVFRSTDIGIVLNPAAQIGFDNSTVKPAALVPQTREKK